MSYNITYCLMVVNACSYQMIWLGWDCVCASRIHLGEGLAVKFQCTVERPRPGPTGLPLAHRFMHPFCPIFLCERCIFQDFSTMIQCGEECSLPVPLHPARVRRHNTAPAGPQQPQQIHRTRRATISPAQLVPVLVPVNQISAILGGQYAIFSTQSRPEQTLMVTLKIAPSSTTIDRMLT